MTTGRSEDRVSSPDMSLGKRSSAPCGTFVSSSNVSLTTTVIGTITSERPPTCTRITVLPPMPLDIRKLGDHLALHGIVLDRGFVPRQIRGGLANINYLVRV